MLHRRWGKSVPPQMSLILLPKELIIEILKNLNFQKLFIMRVTKSFEDLIMKTKWIFTTVTFSTSKFVEYDLFESSLLSINSLHLKYQEAILPKSWPKNLQFLSTYFRPDFKLLPETINKLSIVTQNEVYKNDLPPNIKDLQITAPNSKTNKFNLQNDHFDLYKISIHDFNKYNTFVGGFLHDDQDNIKHYSDLTYNYVVDGDINYDLTKES
jgi:hypothetical protein